MQRNSFFLTITFLALAGAAFAAPTVHEAWASGRISRFDAATHSVIVSQGRHEMTFVLAPNARLTHGKTALQQQDLASDVGHAVKVRYTTGPTGKVADLVEVGAARTATPAPAKMPSRTSKPSKK
ncbi:MAG: hypothetical protein AB7O28_23675 [Vicinamibacterales bacterium]